MALGCMFVPSCLGLETLERTDDVDDKITESYQQKKKVRLTKSIFEDECAD
jgi:hypothetical protein